MDPWPFVIAAYGLTLTGTIGTSLWAWRAAKAAERKAETLRERN
jgi:hypothetical protein